MSTTQEAQIAALSIQTALHAWTQQARAVTTFFEKYEEEAYDQEVAPGRNKATDLLGHLLVTNDGLLPLLGFGDKLFPELETYFVPNTAWTYDETPDLDTLKQKWAQLNDTLTAHFNALQPAGWLDRHTRVSEADFAHEPLRNKLNVLLSRTIHMGYHLGQLAFLQDKAPA